MNVATPWKKARALFVTLATLVGMAFTANAQTSDQLADRRAIIPTAADGATVSSDINGLCVGCTVTDEENVISDRRNPSGKIYIPLGILSSASIRIDLPSSQPARSSVGFVVRDDSGLLDLGVFQRMTIRTYAAGQLQDEFPDAVVADAQVLGLDRYGFKFRTRKAFDAMEVEVAGTALALTQLQVLYGTIVHPRAVEPIIALAADGATVSSETSTLCLGCDVENPANLIDGSLGTAADMTVPLGLAASASVTVDYGTDLPARSWTGFEVSSPSDLLDVAVLSALTISALDDGTVVDQASGSDLRVTEQRGGRFFVRFRSTATFDAVRIQMSSLVGLDLEMGLHQARTIPTGTSPSVQAPPIASAQASVPSGLSLTAPSPNPMRGSGRLSVRVSETQPVRAVLTDAIGRRVAVLHDGVLTPGEHTLRVDAAGLAPGVYRVHLQGTGESRTMTVVR